MIMTDVGVVVCRGASCDGDVPNIDDDDVGFDVCSSTAP